MRVRKFWNPSRSESPTGVFLDEAGVGVEKQIEKDLVLTTRTEPPLPLASLRANNLLLEIDASTLRFDPQETRAFLERFPAVSVVEVDH